MVARYDSFATDYQCGANSPATLGAFHQRLAPAKAVIARHEIRPNAIAVGSLAGSRWIAGAVAGLVRTFPMQHGSLVNHRNTTIAVAASAPNFLEPWLDAK